MDSAIIAASSAAEKWARVLLSMARPEPLTAASYQMLDELFDSHERLCDVLRAADLGEAHGSADLLVWGFAKRVCQPARQQGKEGFAQELETRLADWRESIPTDRLSQLTEQIRAERQRWIEGQPQSQQEPEYEWSEAKSPSDWQKELGISGTTWRRRIAADGPLVVNRITSKSVRIRLDTLRKLKGDD